MRPCPAFLKLFKPLRSSQSFAASNHPRLFAVTRAPSNMALDPLTATAADLQERLSQSTTTSRELVKLYLDQIAKYNGYYRAVIATAPEETLVKIAEDLDVERQRGALRGPLHGIPILIKDNIATNAAYGLLTTCGSLALAGSKPRANATIVDQLQTAGAIILGKSNLSEWAWYKSDLADSGWSAVGGQTQPAYVVGGFRSDDTNGGHSNPGGSSSGSAVAVAVGFSPISVGTETIGSISMPVDRASLYGLKPTPKIVPQEGIVPVSLENDVAGPMAKSALDLANLFDVLVDPTKTNVPSGGFKSCVTGKWGDIRIGYVDPPEPWMLPESIVKPEKSADEQMKNEWKRAIQKLESVVKVVKPVTLISYDDATKGGDWDIWNAFHYTFPRDLKAYLDTVDDVNIHGLDDLIAFNEKHKKEELGPGANHNQNGLLSAKNCGLNEEQYRERIEFARETCGKNGIEKALNDYGVDVILGPGDGEVMSIAGGAGTPVATVPVGYLEFNGRPFGFQVLAKAHQEDLLIRFQSAWEATFPKRMPPPVDEIVPAARAQF